MSLERDTTPDIFEEIEAMNRRMEKGQKSRCQRCKKKTFNLNLDLCNYTWKCDHCYEESAQ